MIYLAGVSATARGRLLLEKLSLNVESAEVHALVGPPKAGKSSALQILMGFRRPDTGFAKIASFDCTTEVAAVRRLVTYVPHAGRLDPQVSPRSHLQWAARFLDLPADSGSIRRALRLAEIPDRYFDSPSHSNPPLVHVLTWIALGDLRQNRTILLDEPTSSTSFSETRQLSALLRERRDGGSSVLLTTRDVRFAEDVADRSTSIELGRTRVDIAARWT